ncbi:MAG TPA: hypothetical protein VJA94_20150 [Candidatus Angelobacter sp.]
MTRETKTLLDAFDALPAEEQQALAHEILRRSLPFDSGPLGDDEIAAASSRLIEFLDTDDASTKSR